MCRDDNCTLRVKLQHIWKMLYRTIYIPSFSWLMRNSLNCFMLVCCMSLDNLKQRLVEWWSLTRYYCSLWRQTQPQDTSDQLRDSLFVQAIPDDSHWLSVIIHFHRDFCRFCHAFPWHDRPTARHLARSHARWCQASHPHWELRPVARPGSHGWIGFTWLFSWKFQQKMGDLGFGGIHGENWI